MPGVRAPCVVMAHGFTGTRGISCLSTQRHSPGRPARNLDYRHFGESEGSPRQIVDIGKQMEDWRSAIAMARTLDRVDSTRIALWGSSLSGGHVINLAAEDPTLAAVVARVPAIDKRAHGISRGKGEDDARRDLGRLTDRSVAPLPRRGNLRRGPGAGRPLTSLHRSIRQTWSGRSFHRSRVGKPSCCLRERSNLAK